MFSVSLSLLVSACSTKPVKENAENTATYFDNTDSGVQTGGVKVIPIQTPKGIFNVWTKRIGNNPTMKVLILHGGPGGTHEAYECFESFLPKEGIEFIYYDHSEVAIQTIHMKPPCMTYRGMWKK